jgi:hypothetical protein
MHLRHWAHRTTPFGLRRTVLSKADSARIYSPSAMYRVATSPLPRPGSCAILAAGSLPNHTTRPIEQMHQLKIHPFFDQGLPDEFFPAGPGPGCPNPN